MDNFEWNGWTTSTGARTRANQSVFLCKTGGFIGPPFAFFCHHALYDSAYGFGASQPIALGDFRSFLYMAGRIMPGQINQGIHAALAGAAFFLEPHFAQIESVRTYAFSLGKQPICFP